MSLGRQTWEYCHRFGQDKRITLVRRKEREFVKDLQEWAKETLAINTDEETGGETA